MLHSLQLKDFRCFTDITVNLNSSLVLIEGLNGSGKTSLFEALHYACYMRSFRALSPREMVRFLSESFFIKIVTDEDILVCGYTKGKRIARLNQQPVIDHATLQKTVFIAITVTEDNLAIIKGEPERRRLYIDQSLTLFDKPFADAIKKYRFIVDSRNAALAKGVSLDELIIWTEQLWHASLYIEQKRKNFLITLEGHVIKSSQLHFDTAYAIAFSYQKKQNDTFTDWKSFEHFWKNNLLAQELRYKRTIFGAHLDDIAIFFQNKLARIYSSRGQQKLILILMNLAFITILQEQGHMRTAITLLLDDFMTDFDHTIARKLIDACLLLNVQCIVTSPSFGSESFEKKLAQEKGALSLQLLNKFN